MFGINSFDQLSDIAQGHYNEIIKKENELHDQRLLICNQCPLFSNTILGPMCDASKCYNTITEQITQYPEKGSICGCGCRLDAKTRLAHAKCVLNKW